MAEKIRVLTREEILAVDDIQEEVVPIPEWGEGAGVVVRGMTMAERIQFVEKSRGPDGKPDTRKMIALSITMGIHEPRFTEDDIPALEQKSSAALERVSKAWLRLSGIGEKALAELRGNS